MDYEWILIWILCVGFLFHGLLNIYFVRWVLWRNETLTKVMVWYHENKEGLEMLHKIDNTEKDK